MKKYKNRQVILPPPKHSAFYRWKYICKVPF